MLLCGSNLNFLILLRSSLFWKDFVNFKTSFFCTVTLRTGFISCFANMNMVVSDSTLISLYGVTHSLLSILFLLFPLFAYFTTVQRGRVKTSFSGYCEEETVERRWEATPTCLALEQGLSLSLWWLNHPPLIGRHDSQLFEIVWVSHLKRYTIHIFEDYTIPIIINMSNICLTTSCLMSHGAAPLPVNLD